MGPAVPEDRTSGPWRPEPCVIVFGGRPMNEDLSVLFDRIGVLLDPPGTGVPTPRSEEVEHTLTDGYARALALEGERLRMERRIQTLAGDVEHAPELRALKSRLEALDAELAQLRDLLRVLAATL
jgi:hypothetical protein